MLASRDRDVNPRGRVGLFFSSVVYFLVLNFVFLRKSLIEIMHQTCWLDSELCSGISKF